MRVSDPTFLCRGPIRTKGRKDETGSGRKGLAGRSPVGQSVIRRQTAKLRDLIPNSHSRAVLHGQVAQKKKRMIKPTRRAATSVQVLSFAT